MMDIPVHGKYEWLPILYDFIVFVGFIIVLYCDEIVC